MHRCEWSKSQIKGVLGTSTKAQLQGNGVTSVGEFCLSRNRVGSGGVQETTGCLLDGMGGCTWGSLLYGFCFLLAFWVGIESTAQEYHHWIVGS